MSPALASLDDQYVIPVGSLSEGEYVIGFDVGGTEFRWRLAQALGGRLKFTTNGFLPTQSVTDAIAAIQRIIEQSGVKPRFGTFAFAGQVVDGAVSGPNLRLRFQAADLANSTGFAWNYLNDFEAVAHAIAVGIGTGQQHLHNLQVGNWRNPATLSIGGMGTGLGNAYVLKRRSGNIVVPTELSHIPLGTRKGGPQLELLPYLYQTMNDVCYDDICSGHGFVRAYRFMVDTGKAPLDDYLAHVMEDTADSHEARRRPALVTQAALQGDSLAASLAVHLVMECLGMFGSNTVVDGASRHVFIYGGIVPKLLGLYPRFLRSGCSYREAFLNGFNHKAIDAALVARIPVDIITVSGLGEIGALVHAAANMAA